MSTSAVTRKNTNEMSQSKSESESEFGIAASQVRVTVTGGFRSEFNLQFLGLRSLMAVSKSQRGRKEVSKNHLMDFTYQLPRGGGSSPLGP